MNKNSLDNFIQRLKNVQLSETERAEVRASIANHIENNQAVRSPWAPVLSPLQSFGQTAMVTAMVLLAVGGVSLAAENSLPGDPLYTVKVNVNEKVMGLTSVTSEDEAENQSRIAARRIAELEALAARGSLDEQVSNSLTQAISEHTKAAREHIQAVSAEGETGSAASLETELFSTLSTHSYILEDLAVSDTGAYASTTAAAAIELRNMAQSKAESDVSTAVGASSQLPVRAGQKDTLSPTQTNKLLQRTADRLETARTAFEKNYNAFGNADIRDSVERLLSISAETIDSAVDSIENESYGAAATSLREALTYAHEATIIIEARRFLERSSNVAADESPENNASSSVATSSNTNEVDGSENTSDQNRVQTAEEMVDGASTTTASSSAATSSPAASSTPPATTTATSSLDLQGAATSSGDNLTRYTGTSSATYRKIDAVLQRVEETLSVSDSNSRAGLLPGRSPRATTSSEGETE